MEAVAAALADDLALGVAPWLAATAGVSVKICCTAAAVSMSVPGVEAVAAALADDLALGVAPWLAATAGAFRMISSAA